MQRKLIFGTVGIFLLFGFVSLIYVLPTSAEPGSNVSQTLSSTHTEGEKQENTSNFSPVQTEEPEIDLMAQYEKGDKHFDEFEIGNRKVYWHQRKIGDAIVERDYILYQFDSGTGGLIKKKVSWSSNLPDKLPQIVQSKEVESRIEGIGGEVLSTQLIYISPNSSVFLIKPTPTNPCWIVTASYDGAIYVSVFDAVTGEYLGDGTPPLSPYTAVSWSGNDQEYGRSCDEWAEFDDFRVRKYCSPEPTYGVWGNEEEGPLPTAWYDPNWVYRQQGNVTSSCGDLSDYQMKLTLNFSSGTSSNGEVYLNEHCQGGFGDIRFTEGDGTTEFNYWLQDYTSNASATVWLNFSSISASTTSFYVYYGNENAESTSDGYSTFPIFNDGASLDGWTPDSQLDWSAESGVIKAEPPIYTYTGGTWSNLYSNTDLTTNSYVVESRIRSGVGLFSTEIRQGIGYGAFQGRWEEKWNVWKLGNTTCNSSTGNNSFDARQWHNYSLTKNGNHWALSVDGLQRVTYNSSYSPEHMGLVAQYVGDYWSIKAKYAAEWFNKMGYNTEGIGYPSQDQLRSHIQSNTTAVWFSMGHGGGTYQTAGCPYWAINGTMIHNWIENYTKMPFSFIVGCVACNHLVSPSLGYELRKGSSEGAVTIHTCGDPGWWFQDWEEVFFTRLNQSYTVREAFNEALADYPVMQYVMRLTGDGSLKLKPLLQRDTLLPTPSPTLTGSPTPTESPTPTTSPTPTVTASPTPTSVPWYNYNWNYRQRGVIASSSLCGDLLNYQMEFTLHYGSGTSNDTDIYLNSNSNSNFSDVRFTKVDGQTLLDYWVQEYTQSDYATVWVNYSDIHDEGTFFFVYYGNNEAESASNGTATWKYFDDFEEDMDGWVAKSGSANCSRWTEQAHNGNYSVSNDAMAEVTEHKFGTLQNPARALVFVYDNASDHTGRFYASIYDGQLHFEAYQVGGCCDNYRYRITDYYNSSVPRSTGWHRFEWVGDSNSWKGYIDNELVCNGSATNWNTIHFGNSWGNGVIDGASMDDVCVGNYCYPEPVFGLWDAETQKPTSTESPTPTPCATMNESPTPTPTPSLIPTCEWDTSCEGTNQKLFRDVWVSDSNNVFAVGDDGKIINYKGGQWKYMTSGTTSKLRGVWGTNSSDVYAVGDTTLHYNGTRWSDMNSAITESLRDIWGTSSNNIFAVGMNGTIAYYANGIWSEMASGTTDSLLGVWGTSASNVYAVGINGTILNYQGTSWSPMNSNTTAWLDGIWGTNSSNIYAVGFHRTEQDPIYQEGIVMHYNGTGWSKVDIGIEPLVESWLTDIWGSSSSDIYAVGNGCILHFNGGAWRYMNICTNRVIYGVLGSPFSDVYAVGADACLLHYIYPPTPTPSPSPTPTESPSPTATVTASPTPTSSPTPTPGPGDVNCDKRINACDITQTELCILYPEKYPKENYCGWDANEDGQGPNSGDILAVEYRILGAWPPITPTPTPSGTP